MTLREFILLVIFAVAVSLILSFAAWAGECRGELVRASYYGTESGNRTASGEPFDGSRLTAAHRTLPFGTRLRVSYNGKSVVVRVNDRGPFIRGRSIDLSRAAAQRIGMIHAGVATVCIERL